MSLNDNLWSVPCGQSAGFRVTITDGANNALAGYYDGSETLEASVWQGGALLPLSSIVALAWVSGPLGTTTAAIVGANTADVTPGVYRLLFSVAKSGSSFDYFEGLLELTDAPGADAAPAVYGTLQDLRDIAASWFASLGSKGKMTNLLSERGRARSWLDDAIVGKSRPYDVARVSLLDAGNMLGPLEAEDSYVRGLLDANALMVDRQAREIVAYKALAFACEGKVMIGDDQAAAWERRAALCHARAQNRLLCYRAQLDTNSDGVADIGFNLGMYSAR